MRLSISFGFLAISSLVAALPQPSIPTTSVYQNQSSVDAASVSAEPSLTTAQSQTTLSSSVSSSVSSSTTFMALTTSQTQSSASSSTSSVSTNAPTSGFVHKDPPSGAHTKETVDTFAQLPAYFVNNPSVSTTDCPTYSPHDTLVSCLWVKYNTTAWLQSYFVSLLAKYGKTTTKDLEYEWPYYLALDYQSFEWSCLWNGNCDNTPVKPNDDTDINKLNAYFVLEATNRWTTYMQVHRKMLEISKDTFADSTDSVQGLNGIVSQFSAPSERMPNVNNFNGEALWQVVDFVLSQIPVLDDTMSAIDFDKGFVQLPTPPPDNTISILQQSFKNMCDAYEEQLRQAFITFLADSTYSVPLIENGAYLPRPTKEVDDIWSDPAVSFI
jgi:hypothetical protein